MSVVNYFRVLGVGLDAEDVVIQAAYRALMRRYHPDTNRDPSAKDASIRINEAYKILIDPVTRGRHREQILQTYRDKKKKADAKEYKSNRDDIKKEPVHEQPIVQPEKPKGDNTGPWGWIISLSVIGLLTISLLIAGNPNEFDASRNEITVEDAEEPVVPQVADPQTLASTEAPEVEFSNVERGAKFFARTFTNVGLVEARRQSERCHASVLAKPDWLTADRCAAFDFAAAHVDERISREASLPVDPYFAFQKDNQEREYLKAGAEPFSMASRITAIRENAGRIADDELARLEAVRMQLARDEAVRQPTNETASEPDNVVSGATSNDAGELDRISNTPNR